MILGNPCSGYSLTAQHSRQASWPPRHETDRTVSGTEQCAHHLLMMRKLWVDESGVADVLSVHMFRSLLIQNNHPVVPHFHSYLIHGVHLFFPLW